jgi:O-antigen/teichoic acid export membrane protein
VSKLQVGRGAIYLYIENISSMFFGYAFWFILSRIATPEIVGISSSLISIAAIFISIASLGVPLGAIRFLGKIFLERKFEDSIVYIKSSFLIVSIGLVASGLVILISREMLFSNFSIILVNVTFILIIISTISNVIRAIVIASLDTKKILFASTISSAVKLFAVISLLSFGTGEAGALAAYTITPILSSVLLTSNVMTLLKQADGKTMLRFMNSFRILLKASITGWIPLSIDTIGAQLATIVILGVQGPSQAALYFIAFQISTGILTVIWALEYTTYPALSAKDKGRKKFVWRTIKICLVILLPVSFAVIFYSKNIMGLFGSNYIEGSPALQILLLSVFPTTVMNAISILTYAYGNYKHVLSIGLGTAIPRTIMYFVFVPWYGISGAALSYTLSSIFGFAISILISRQIGMIIHWKDLALMITIAVGFPFLLSSLEINYILGVVLSVSLSYILFIKVRLLERDDVQDFLEILPRNIASPVIRIVNKIGTILNSKY